MMQKTRRLATAVLAGFFTYAAITKGITTTPGAICAGIAVGAGLLSIAISNLE
jgi:hypothetical protein